ncbi:putative nuclease HARBI1 isoform X2 [Eupeodes corollae]|uniref:putative nuclease HARBI1 isoform X2 n=1 Tax=Eupeodes corollae TaxID=290404 RepID=UPI0024904DB4|nr:putative nuclease HARBI1 isoform X2 [Eupeodes corollae]
MESIMVYIYSESEEFEESSRLRVSRRLLRRKSSPLDLPSTEFIKLFRLSKEAFIFILQEISEEFKDQNSNGIPSILKLAATMRFLAEGSYQKGVGQDVLLGMAQPTVSNVLSETLKILERKLCPKMINLKMNEQEKLEEKTTIYENSGFPGVIMCVDGTHVSIIRPTTNEHHFYNRKGYHSLNACDHKMRITCVNPSYGGSSHDSVVWSMSKEGAFMEEQFRHGDSSKILGDAGYALEPWMMTPYRAAVSGSREANFNPVHSKCRNVIKRCFGLLKGRFFAI